MLNILQADRRMPIRGVLFDMDGVVIDTEKLYTRFWMEAARDLGHPMTLDQALQLRSLGKVHSQAKLDSFFGPVLDYDTLRSRRIELMEAFIAANGVEEKPGIRELLARLKEKKIPCAITSSSSVPLIRRHLGDLGLLDGFTAIEKGEEVEISVDAVNVRSYPSTASSLSIRGSLKLGDKVTRVAVSEKWSRILYEVVSETETDEEGNAKKDIMQYYISNDCLKVPDTETTAAD